MLNPQVVNIICHTFACPQKDIKWAEEKGERLLAKYGSPEVFEYLNRILHRLSEKSRWAGYEKMALVKMVLTFLEEEASAPALES